MKRLEEGPKGGGSKYLLSVSMEQQLMAFGGSLSGYGVDILLCHDVRRRFSDTVAVINEVTRQHLRAPDTNDIDTPVRGTVDPARPIRPRFGHGGDRSRAPCCPEP